MVARVSALLTEREENSDRTRCQFLVGEFHPAGLGETVESIDDPGRVLVEQVVEVALEVGGDLDIHGGGKSRHHVTNGIIAVVDEAGQDIVLVGGQQELA